MQTIRALVLDGSDCTHRRIVETKCSLDATLGEVLNALHEKDIVFANGADGVRWISGCQNGKWLSKQAAHSYTYSMLAFPHAQAIKVGLTVRAFFGRKTQSPLDDVHLLLHVPLHRLPPMREDILAQLHRIKMRRLPLALEVALGEVVVQEMVWPDDLPAGGLPDTIYQRHSDIVVLGLLKAEVIRCKANYKNPKLALVGSPGIGKSTLINLLCWELMGEEIDIVYLHRDKSGDVTIRFFTKDGFLIVGQGCGCSVRELLAVFTVTEGRALSPLIILDGFPLPTLSPTEWFHIFVSSGGFNEPSLGSKMILLPSWSRREVESLPEPIKNTTQSLRLRYTKYGGDRTSSSFSRQRCGKESSSSRFTVGSKKANKSTSKWPSPPFASTPVVQHSKALR